MHHAERFAAHWGTVWNSMLDQSLQTILVWGQGTPGSYGASTFLTGRVPSPKGELVLLTVGRPPCIVFPTAADAAAATDDDAVFEADHAALGESVVSKAVRLLGPQRELRAVGYATADGRGLPQRLWNELTHALGFEPVDYTAEFTEIRAHKSEADLDAMRGAVALGEACLEYFRQRFRPGMTEREGAGLLAGPLLSAGGSLPLLFVSCGTFTGGPPGTRRLAADDVVSATVEFAALDGSWVELGALFCAEEPSRADHRMIQDLLDVQRLAESTVRTGQTFGGTAELVLSEIGARGWVNVDGLGHGTGIDEEPIPVALGVDQPYAARSLVALHPSLRTPTSLRSASVANVVAATVTVGEPLSDYPHRMHLFG